MKLLIHLIKLISDANVPCPFHILTGLYCPGCGGTRAVVFLLEGHPLLSFIYHPIVIYVASILAYIIIRDVLSLILGERLIAKAHFHSWYLWVALAIITLNFIIKNLLLVFYGIDLMPLRY